MTNELTQSDKSNESDKSNASTNQKNQVNQTPVNTQLYKQDSLDQFNNMGQRMGYYESIKSFINNCIKNCNVNPSRSTWVITAGRILLSGNNIGNIAEAIVKESGKIDINEV